MFVFAGSSAEFALNKAVDWLYFTGKLPSDPIGRLFSTVLYARRIVFSDLDSANKAIDQITSIHSAVENKRGSKIPDWAYRDVLFMLIYYSQASYELLVRKMSEKEKEEMFDVFNRVGIRMGIKNLPVNYKEWLEVREKHLRQDLMKSDLTTDLYKQYRKHLGSWRFKILLESQKMVLPEYVSDLLGFRKIHWFRPLIFLYKSGVSRFS